MCSFIASPWCLTCMVSFGFDPLNTVTDGVVAGGKVFLLDDEESLERKIT